jgi:hypothetical protein
MATNTNAFHAACTRLGVRLDPRDARDLRGLLLCAHATEWQHTETRDGRAAWSIPSTRTPGRRYVTTAATCTCRDARDGQHCKHRRAVALFQQLLAVV